MSPHDDITSQSPFLYQNSIAGWTIASAIVKILFVFCLTALASYPDSLGTRLPLHQLRVHFVFISRTNVTMDVETLMVCMKLQALA